MDEINDTLWRSIDSNPLDSGDVSSCDTSFKSFNDLSVEIISPGVAPEQITFNVGDDLLDALRSLQISSAKKISAFRVCSVSHENNDQSETVTSKCNNIFIEHITDKQHDSTTLTEKEQKEENNIVEAKPSSSPLKGPETSVDSCNNDKTLAIAPQVIENIVKAVKPCVKTTGTNRKITKCISPVLHTENRSRLRKMSLNPLHQTTTNNKSKNNNMLNVPNEKGVKRSTSLKQRPIRNVVATVVSTKDGIKLKDEKINNFGIPINVDRKKKRTQPIPFSFTSRPKDPADAKLPMRDANANSQTQLRKSNDIHKSTQPRKLDTFRKSFMNKHDTLTNKENNMTNVSRSQALSTGSILSGGKLKERLKFDEKVKQRQKELAEMKLQVELKKLEREKGLKLESSKKMIPLPVKLKKPVVKSQRST